jgi:hypothetical protein
MGGVLWDTFTGSAAYRDIFLRAVQPSFLWNLAVSFIDGNVFGHSTLSNVCCAEGD